MRFSDADSHGSSVDVLAAAGGVRSASVVTTDVHDQRTRRLALSRSVQQGLKRLIDVVGSAVGLALLSPILLTIGVLIRFDSPGPVIFRQKRFGKNGRPFTFFKFRTMVDGNDPAIHREYVSKLMQGDASDQLRGENGAFKLESDPRVTKLGRILRRTSADELPQLWNVLKGGMSLVGPRPPLDYEVEMYEPRQARRLSVLPGMTGLWQVSGRTETTFERMIELDLSYVESWSVLLDIRILYRTIFVVLGRKGAW